MSSPRESRAKNPVAMNPPADQGRGPQQDPLADLQAKLAKEIEPVRPFLPSRISAKVALIGCGLGVSLLLPSLGLRPDAAKLGQVWLWGPTLVSLSMGVVLITLALRRLVPANHLPAKTLIAIALASIAACSVLYFGVHRHSGVETPHDRAFEIGLLCFTMEMCLAIPILLGLAFVARRGLTAEPVMPAWVGALGVAWLSDGVWRLFCQYSAPGHVARAHGAGVLAVVFVAALAAFIWDRRRLRARLRARGSRTPSSRRSKT